MKRVNILRPASVKVAEKKHVVVFKFLPRLGSIKTRELLDYSQTRIKYK